MIYQRISGPQVANWYYVNASGVPKRIGEQAFISLLNRRREVDLSRVSISTIS